MSGYLYVWRVAWSARALSHRPDLQDVAGPPMSIIDAFRYAIMVARQVGAI